MNFQVRWCAECRAYLGVIDDELGAAVGFPHTPGCSKGERAERERMLDELAEADRWR